MYFANYKKLTTAVKLYSEGKSIAEIATILKYKYRSQLHKAIQRAGGKITKEGIIFQKPLTYVERYDTKKDELPKTKIVTRTCCKCKKKFKTQLDITGYPLNNRCENCKRYETKYYNPTTTYQEMIILIKKSDKNFIEIEQELLEDEDE